MSSENAAATNIDESMPGFSVHDMASLEKQVMHHIDNNKEDDLENVQE